MLISAMTNPFFSRDIQPDFEGLIRCIRRDGLPNRVHFIELFLDGEMQQAVCDRFALAHGLDKSDPYFDLRRQIAIQRFLGYDYVRCGIDNFNMLVNRGVADDTAGLQRSGGRSFVDEHTGPIANWKDFERYPWPKVSELSTRSLEWYEKNLPDDMCVIGSGGFAHYAEYMLWLMGYESLCFALYEQRDLVAAIMDRLREIYRGIIKRILQFQRVKIIWGSDNMGFRSGTLVSPDDLREFVLPGHREMAAASHTAGRPYLLHSCGQITAIMEDLIENVRIDARHSFEDTIEPVTEAKRKYGGRIAILGGIDVDFLCRSTGEQVRQRVRQTLDVCMTGGGYCLGTGNSVTNYIPADNYLAMQDEGRRW